MKLTSNVLSIIRLLTFMLPLCVCFWANAQISGVVYKDYNNNGSQTPPHEVGIRGITVTAYIGDGSASLSTVTDINGLYAFASSQLPTGTKVRLEFSGLEGNNNGKKGGDSFSNVQFYTIPSGGVINANLGVLSNDDYCKLESSILFTPCYVNGNPIPGSSAGEDDALVMFPYNSKGVAGVDGPMPTHLAKASEVGALWGMDYQARAKLGLTSAIVRRHVGLGPLGTGGIYKIDFTALTTSPLVDVKTLGIDTGPDPHVDLSPDKLQTSQDAASMTAAGKTGIGGIALSRDEKSVYLVNLYDRKIYSFYVGLPASTPDPSSVKSFQIPNPCSDGDYRPWGIKEFNGKFYIGVVCSAETSQDSTKLLGTIYEFDPNNGQFKVFFQFPLTEKRGPADATDDCINIRYWRPWTDVFPKPCATFFEPGIGKTVGFAVNPQPIITDLEFDADGSMIIGLMDRMSLQGGFRAVAPVDDGNVYDTFVSGDILRVYNNNGKYEMESNGKAGPLTGCGVGNGEGPGGGEFYCRDYWVFFGNPGHSEVANGGLMLVPGTGEILTSAMDPVDTVFHAAGIKVFSNTDGSSIRDYAVYAGKKGTLGKSGGTGDIKASCGNAPIELGNRVWNDIDKDGIQDPNEDGIDGVEVKLLDMENGGAEIAKVTTSNGGVFCFNETNTTTPILYEHNYKVKVLLNQNPIKSRKLTQISPGGLAPDGDLGEDMAEARDSDAILENDCAIINFKTGAYTLSNHNLDFGLTSCVAIDSIDVSSCNPMTNRHTLKVYTYYTNTTAKQIRVKITKPTGETIKDTLFTTVSTQPNQLTTFNNLESLGLANMKVSVSVVGSESIVGCVVDSLYNSPVPCLLKSSIGNYVWYDHNKNGIQDNRVNPITQQVIGPEKPVPGVRLMLMSGTPNTTNQRLKVAATPVAIDTTDANGFYLFTNLIPGDYYIAVDTASLPDGYGLTFPNRGGDDNYDSDLIPLTNQSDTTTLAPGEIDLTWDIGIFKGAKPSITDPCVCNNEIIYGLGFDKYVYNEQIEVIAEPNDFWFVIAAKDNKTGYQTKGLLLPHPIDGFPAEYNPAIDGIRLLTEVSSGKYKFDFFHYDQEGYEIVVTNGIDTLSIKNLCYNAKVQGSELLETYCPNDKSVYTLQNNYPTGTTKYYFLKKGAFSFAATNDTIPDISTLTEITQIKPSDYADGDTIALVVVWIPNASQPIAPNGLPYKNCVVKTIVNIAFSVSLANCQRGSLGDFVWKDRNRNGIQDPDESGVAGVKIEIYKNGTYLSNTTTDTNGKYLFTDLDAGNYNIKVVANSLPTDCRISTKRDVGDDAKDSDVNSTTEESGIYVLVPDEPTRRHNLTVDVGLEPFDCTGKCIAVVIKKVR